MLWRTGLVVLVFALGQVIGEEAVNAEVWEADTRAGVSRVLSGWDAYPGQHPHHATLRGFRNQGSIIICGGAVISRQWVLSSAVCLRRVFGLLVRLGVTDITTPQELQESLKWYPHPTYDELNSAVQPNDIGLVKLQHPVVYTDLLQRINIQSSSEAFRNYEDEIMQFTGHGRLWTNGELPVNLQWVYLRAITNRACQSHFGSFVNENIVCTRGYNVTSQAPCWGDAGGPLVHTDPEGVRSVVGVYSFRSTGGCHLGTPAGFTRPGSYHSWFTEVTGIDFENFFEEEVYTTTPPPLDVKTEVTTMREPELDSTTIPPTTIEEQQESTTTIILPPTEEWGEDNSTIKPPPTESDEDESDSDEDSDDSSDSESDERPGVIKKKKKLEMKIKFKVKVKKEIKVKKMHFKKEHPARPRLQ